MRYSSPLSVAVSAQSEQGAMLQRTGVFYSGNNGPQQAMMAAQIGDVVLVNPTVYMNFAITLPQTITIASAAPFQKYTFDVGGSPNRCIELALNVGLTLEDAELCNNKVEWANAGGIWPTGGPYSLIVRRCVFHDLNNGIIIGEHREATVLIEDSESYDNGDYDGYGHNFYIGPVQSLTVRGVWSHMVKNRGDAGVPNVDISWGHLFKSRAQVALFEGNRFTQENGEPNRCLDCPNGGDVTVVGNLFELNAETMQNQGYGQFMSYGVEDDTIPENLPVHKLNVQQNTFVNHGNATKQFLFIKNTLPSVYSVVDNIFAGLTAPYVQGDPSYQLSETDNSFVPLSTIPGHASFDFTPATPIPGSKNWATLAYQHPTSTVVRTDSFRGGVPA
jgi:hypothetical protein